MAPSPSNWRAFPHHITGAASCQSQHRHRHVHQRAKYLRTQECGKKHHHMIGKTTLDSIAWCYRSSDLLVSIFILIPIPLKSCTKYLIPVLWPMYPAHYHFNLLILWAISVISVLSAEKSSTKNWQPLALNYSQMEATNPKAMGNPWTDDLVRATGRRLHSECTLRPTTGFFGNLWERQCSAVDLFRLARHLFGYYRCALCALSLHTIKIILIYVILRETS